MKGRRAPRLERLLALALLGGPSGQFPLPPPLARAVGLDSEEPLDSGTTRCAA